MARKASSYLLLWARKVRDLEVMASGSPKKVAWRARNKILGRKLSRLFRW